MSTARTQITKSAAALNIHLPPGSLDRFDRYLDEVLRWRTRFNLTAVSSRHDIVVTHFIDSLLLLSVVEIPERAAVVDVGTGAGFPGIPIKLVRPDLRVVLVDAARKRVAFVEHVVDVLALSDVRVIWARAEVLAADPGQREHYDVSVERALASLGVAAELCLPLVGVGGSALFLKGPSAVAEVQKAIGLMRVLGGTLEVLERRTLPTTEKTRIVIGLRKATPTPRQFPRSPGRLGQATDQG